MNSPNILRILVLFFPKPKRELRYTLYEKEFFIRSRDSFVCHADNSRRDFSFGPDLIFVGVFEVVWKTNNVPRENTAQDKWMNEWMIATEFHLKTRTAKLKLEHYLTAQTMVLHALHEKNKLLDTFLLTSCKDFVHDLQGLNCVTKDLALEGFWFVC